MRGTGLTTNNNTLIMVVILAVIAMWYISKNKLAYNAETVTVQRDARGRIAGMTVNRSAH